MKEIEVFTFLCPPDAWHKKPHHSSLKLTREQAAKRYPGSVPIESTREVQTLADGGPIPSGQPYHKG